MISLHRRGAYMYTKTSLYNPMRTFSFIFFIVGFILLLTGIVNIVQITNFRKHVIQEKAVIVHKVGENNNSIAAKDTLVSYALDGKVYENISLGKLLIEDIGSEINIYVNPKKPLSVSTDYKNYSMGIVFLVFGILFSFSSGFALLKILKRDKEIQLLLQDGNASTVKIVEVQCNTTIRVRGKNPYYIVCKLGEQIFYSENIWHPLQDGLVDRDISLYHPQNSFQPYYVDCSALLAKGER